MNNKRKEVSVDDIEIVKCWDIGDSYLYLFKVKEEEVEALDRKFRIVAHSIKSKKPYSHNNAILFLASDALLPDLLDKYLELCSANMVDERQMRGTALLKDRVIAWQRANMKKVHKPDVEEGEEENRVCKANK